ncbi:MAG: DUF378 domain-containing protein [Oscillospiraceae bacterium]|nr:DUF378 domain-containing protein [Oscillospiraceae bacterium]
MRNPGIFLLYAYFWRFRGFYGCPRKRNGGIFVDTLALILSIIGSLNWGLVGIFQFDLVAWLFGGQDMVISRILYTVIGLAGLWCISLLFRRFRRMDGE